MKHMFKLTPFAMIASAFGSIFLGFALYYQETLSEPIYIIRFIECVILVISGFLVWAEVVLEEQ